MRMLQAHAKQPRPKANYKRALKLAKDAHGLFVKVPTSGEDHEARATKALTKFRERYASLMIVVVYSLMTIIA